MEVPIESTSQLQIQLPLNETLRDAKRITGVVAYKVGTVSVAPTSALAVVNNTVFLKSFLTLTNVNNEQALSQIPLSDLERSGNAGIELDIEVAKFSANKSFIQISTAASISTSEVFLLRFEYEK